MASFTKEERIEHDLEQNHEYDEEFSDNEFGDRRNELVLIWVGMDQEEITKILEEALVTEEEYNNPDSWKDFKDTLPAWV